MRPVQERLNEKYVVGLKTGCWLWTAYVASNGYGKISFKSQARYAHRVSYQIKCGKIPEGLQLDHLCRVRHCVNPAHLEAVTGQVNIARGQTGWNMKMKTHCPQGHAYSVDNIYFVPNKLTCRICKKCKNRHTREYYYKSKALKISNK